MHTLLRHALQSTQLLSSTPLTSFLPDGPPVLAPSPKFVKDPVNGWIIGQHPEASRDCHSRLQAMLLERRDTCFAYSMQDLKGGYTGHMGPMRITLKPGYDVTKLYSPRRRYSPHEQDITNEKCNELRDCGFIQPAPKDSCVASCPTLPSKKDLDGKPTDTRFCIDIRKVNQAILLDKYGLHLPEELFQRVGQSKWFTKIDLRGAFHQIPIHPDDQYLTTFHWGNELWCYNRVVYGIATAPSVLQRIMDAELSKAGLSAFAACFIDDLIVHSDTEEEHLLHVAAVLDMLHACGLRAHPDKSIFFCDAVEYLGFLIGTGFLSPHQAKVEAIQALRSPNTVKQLQAVLGLCNYYRCFLPDFSVIAHDLYHLTKPSTPWNWTSHHQTIFDQLKDLLCEEGRVLQHYRRNADTIVYTDWSNYGMGAVLAQVNPDTGREHMVACLSRSLNKHEANYGSYHGELLAAVWAIKSFRHYLHGISFRLITDHQPLKWLLSTPDLIGKPARWMLMVQEYVFTVEHRPGKDNVNADVLSRFPLPTTYDPTGSRLDTDPADDQHPSTATLRRRMDELHLTDPPTTRRRSSATTPAAASAASGRSTSAAADAAATAAPAAAAATAAAAAAAAPGQHPPPASPTMQHLPNTPASSPPFNPAAMLSSWPTALHATLASQAAALAQPCVAGFMDTYAPPRTSIPAQDWLPDNWWDPDASPAEADAADNAGPRWWEGQARAAVCAAAGSIQQAVLSTPQPLQLGDPLPGSVWRETKVVSNTPVGADFYSAAAKEGVVLVELFGGLCAGLEMLLSCGYSVCQYLYCDNSPAARKLALHRMHMLSMQYPSQLPTSAFQDSLFMLPADVRNITSEHVEAAMQLQPGKRCLLVAGWPCEDLSAAGKGLGLAGPRSITFFDAVRVLGLLQQMLPHPPAYLLENTYMEWPHTPEHIRTKDFPRILQTLGPSVVADAARFNSGTYRVRNWWTNLQPWQLLELVLNKWQRSPGILATDLLDPGRTPLSLGRRQQGPPMYPCNSNPAQVEALPTLVSYPQSNNFREKHAGVLFDSNNSTYTEPNADERERLLGYDTGTTAAPGLTEAERFRLTGQCMDANTLKAIFTSCLMLDDVLPTLHHDRPEQRAAAPLPQLTPLTPQQWNFFSKPSVFRSMRNKGWRPGCPLGLEGRGRLVAPLRLPSNFKTAGLGLLASEAATTVDDLTDTHGLGFNPSSQPAAAASTSNQLGGESPEGVHSPHLILPAVALTSLTSPSLLAQMEQLELSQVLADMEEGLHLALTTVAATSLNNAAAAAAAAAAATASSSTPAAEQLPVLPLPGEPPDHVTSSHPDIWADYHALWYLRWGSHKAGTSPKEKQRVWKRLRAFRWLDGSLQRRMSDGVWRVVPAPHQRTELILHCHRSTGHWGIRRTHYMVGLQHWWSNMKEDVQRVLQTCVECSRIKASFSAKAPQLQPLAIEGLFYRWSVDLCGPFPVSKRGNRYVMVMIDSFSKQVEVEALPDKSAAGTAYAFVRNVLCRYGACAEVVSDQGSEFLMEFHQVLKSAFIDHRTTSANHPSANGLAERMVQSIKRALEKYAALEDGTASAWDDYLPHIALGYRVSVQASLGFSPYELLYGTKAILPSSIRPLFEQPLELENPEQAAEYLLKRAAALQQHCAIAGNNLRIAQHRDQLRYLKMRSGYYNTTTTKFAPGDLVYVRRPNAPLNMQSSVRNGVYRIREVRDSGTLVVHGKCGTVTEVHSTNCAPCHLANINPAIDPTLREIPADHACHLCGAPDREEVMLICDGCLRGYHLDCLVPPLETIPAESPWCCTECLQQGLTPAILEELLRQDQRQQGVDRPVLRDQRQVMEDKASAMNEQPVLLRVLEAGRAPVNITAKLTYLHPDQREDARRPLMLKAAGFKPISLPVSKATRATRSRMDIHLSRELDPASSAQYATMAFVAAQDNNLQGTAPVAFSDSYQLSTAEGYQALYQDAFDTLQGCPTEGEPLQWVPELEWILDSTPADLLDPFQAADLKLLFDSVDLQGCFRIGDPVAQSIILQQALQSRYQRKLVASKVSHPHPSNWLTPGHYRHLAAKGPLDWIFLYPPLSIADLSLAIAASRARVGVALWVPRAYLSNLTSVRLALLSAFKVQRRLLVVQDWDRDHLWVCIFSSTTHRTRMLCPSSAAVTSWTSI
jgi:transposase InsO family protein